MTWAKIDDAAPTHPKILRARPEAAWLWTCGLCWSNKHHTDGHIPDDMIDGLSPGTWTARQVRQLARRLVEVGLWHADEERGGWMIHDYADHQEPALKVNAERKKELARERKRRQRAREAQESEVIGHAVTVDVTRDTGVTVTRDGPRDASRDRPRDTTRDEPRDEPRDSAGDVRADSPAPVTLPRPVPTRPDPSRSPSESDHARAPESEEMSPARVWKALDEAWFEAFEQRLPGVWSPLFRADAEAVLARCGGTREGVLAEVSGFVRWSRGRDALPAEPWRKFFGSIGSWAGRVEGDKARAKAAEKTRAKIAAERTLAPSANGTPDAEETDRRLAKSAPSAGEVVPLVDVAAGVLAELRGGAKKGATA